jgi:hypothetical protein
MMSQSENITENVIWISKQHRISLLLSSRANLMCTKWFRVSNTIWHIRSYFFATTLLYFIKYRTLETQKVCVTGPPVLFQADPRRMLLFQTFSLKSNFVMRVLQSTSKMAHVKPCVLTLKMGSVKISLSSKSDVGESPYKSYQQHLVPANRACHCDIYIAPLDKRHVIAPNNRWRPYCLFIFSGSPRRQYILAALAVSSWFVVLDWIATMQGKGGIVP